MSSAGKKFSFTSTALAHDSFDVVSFTGTEGLSKHYRFDITLVSENGEVNLRKVIKSRARLTILREYGDITFNGILSGFDQLETAHGLTRYRAVLTPAFWRQTLTHHNQIFLDKTSPQIIEAAMRDGGLTSLDYEFRLTGQYAPHDYICQYNESHYSFISRLMEREGIYYYFEQGEDNEKVIITDTAHVHSVMDEGIKMHFAPISGLNESEREEVIQSMVCCQKMLPEKVLLKSYDYHKPSLDLTAGCEVSPDGVGEFYVYGVKYSTPEEGARLAKVCAESLRCRGQIFQGESLVPYLRPGYIFSLEGHPRKDFNISYLTTDITHHGDQNFMFTAGLAETGSIRERSSCYRNSFSAISSDIQFRPEHITERPRIPGGLYAHIDAEGSGQYAEIDEQGRYKVVLPFDLNSVKGGKASCWLRKAQPYAGSNHGMHFPLHKGTEVLLAFIGGDPDRPLIAAAVSNPLMPSQVTARNATQSLITTAGGNKLHFEDMVGSEQVLLRSPRAESMITMGAAAGSVAATGTGTAKESQDSSSSSAPGGTSKDHKAVLDQMEKDGIHSKTEGDITFECDNSISCIKGNETTEIWGDYTEKIHGASEETINGTSVMTVYGAEADTVFGARAITTFGAYTDTAVGAYLDIKLGPAIEIDAAIKLELQAVGSFEFGTEKVFNHAAKTEINGETTTVNGVSTHVTGQHTTVDTSHTAVVSDKTEVAANKLVTIADFTEMYAKEEKIAAIKTELIDAKKTVGMSETKILETATKMYERSTTMGQEEICMNLAKTLISNKVTFI